MASESSLMEAVEPTSDEWKRTKRRLNDCFTFAATASCTDSHSHLSPSNVEVRCCLSAAINLPLSRARCQLNMSCNFTSLFLTGCAGVLDMPRWPPAGSLPNAALQVSQICACTLPGAVAATVGRFSVSNEITAARTSTAGCQVKVSRSRPGWDPA